MNEKIASPIIVNKNKLFLIFWIFAFKFSIDYSYIQFVSPLFSYAGMINDLNIYKLFEGWIIVLIMALASPYKIRKPSEFFIIFSMVIFYIPIVSFYSLSNQSSYYFYIIISTWFFSTWSLGKSNFFIPTLIIGEKKFILFLFFFVFFLTLFITYLVGFSNINFDLTKEYQFRPIISEKLSGYGLPYFTAWMPAFLGPLILSISLIKRRYFLFIFITLMHIFWFGITSHKTPMFIPFLVLGIWYWFKKRNESWFIPMGAAILMLSTLFIYFLYDFGLPASLMNRRVFMIPAKLTFDYYVFFENNNLLWSNSFLSNFLNYPYEDAYPHIIGNFNGTGDYANVGFVATGFMHAGLLGLFLYVLIYTIILKIVDSISLNNLPTWFAICCLVMPINIIITSGDLLTAMLTHGLVVAIFLLYLSRIIFRNS